MLKQNLSKVNNNYATALLPWHFLMRQTNMLKSIITEKYSHCASCLGHEVLSCTILQKKSHENTQYFLHYLQLSEMYLGLYPEEFVTSKEQ